MHRCQFCQTAAILICNKVLFQQVAYCKFIVFSAKMTSEKDDFVYKAKLAEQAERYDEMVQQMKSVVSLLSATETLTVEERNLLSVAYKNVIGARRASWRIVTSIEQKEEAKGAEAKLKIIKGYKKSIEDELNKICNEVIALLKDKLQDGGEDEAKVFYYKMEGDYHRYMAEYLTGDSRNERSTDSLNAYGTAVKVADNLASTHPIRLGLALNFSVFYYEILNSPDKACELAKKAFDDAIAELDTLSEDSYKDSTLIMQLLRDNLTLWTSDLQGPENEQGVENLEDEK